MNHYPQCDKAWNWPDFMGGRGIKRKDCWMCGLLDEARAAALRDAVPLLKGILLEVEQHMDRTDYRIYKEYRKEVFVRFQAAIEALGGER